MGISQQVGYNLMYSVKYSQDSMLSYTAAMEVYSAHYMQ